jgi:hypothetical protein
MGQRLVENAEKLRIYRRSLPSGVFIIFKGGKSMNLSELNACFDQAEQNDGNFIAVRIEMEGFPKPELIINERENFQAKKEYYNRAYNEDCTLKTFQGIRIVAAGWGTSDEIGKIPLWEGAMAYSPGDTKAAFLYGGEE